MGDVGSETTYRKFPFSRPKSAQVTRLRAQVITARPRTTAALEYEIRDVANLF